MRAIRIIIGWLCLGAACLPAFLAFLGLAEVSTHRSDLLVLFALGLFAAGLAGIGLRLLMRPEEPLPRKRRLLWTILAVPTLLVLGWLVWLSGMFFEAEYPYYFTLCKVGNAVTARGVAASQIIKADGAPWAKSLPWHTCSYCNIPFDGESRLVLVTLPVPGGNSRYYFAYCFKTHELVPAMDKTANHFPALMPQGDSLRSLSELRVGRGGGFGEGEIKLPANWWAKVSTASLPEIEKPR